MAIPFGRAAVGWVASGGAADSWEDSATGAASTARVASGRVAAVGAGTSTAGAIPGGSVGVAAAGPPAGADPAAFAGDGAGEGSGSGEAASAAADRPPAAPSRACRPAPTAVSRRRRERRQGAMARIDGGRRTRQSSRDFRWQRACDRGWRSGECRQPDEGGREQRQQASAGATGRVAVHAGRQAAGHRERTRGGSDGSGVHDGLRTAAGRAASERRDIICGRDSAG